MDTKNHVYQGINQPRCTVDQEPLPLEASLEVKSHSPDGFAWGYGGSGPSQLALAIMLIETPDEETALKYYQDFKGEVIARFNIDSNWTLTSYDVQTWLRDKQREEKLQTPPKPYVRGDLTTHDCYQQALRLNEEAGKEGGKGICVVDMDYLRINMHNLKGMDFVTWFQESFGKVVKRED